MEKLSLNQPPVGNLNQANNRPDPNTSEHTHLEGTSISAEETQTIENEQLSRYADNRTARHNSLLPSQPDTNNKSTAFQRTAQEFLSKGTSLLKPRRSKEGQYGVQFVTLSQPNSDSTTLAIKFVENASTEVFGNNLARFFHISAPESFTLSSTDAILAKHFENKPESTQAAVIEHILATPLNEITPGGDGPTEFLHNKSIWIDVGKVAAFDALIGNVDRFVFFGMNNHGNFMVKNSLNNEAEPKLVLIDQAPFARMKSEEIGQHQEKIIRFTKHFALAECGSNGTTGSIINTLRKFTPGNNINTALSIGPNDADEIACLMKEGFDQFVSQLDTLDNAQLTALKPAGVPDKLLNLILENKDIIISTYKDFA